MNSKTLTPTSSSFSRRALLGGLPATAFFVLTGCASAITNESASPTAASDALVSATTEATATSEAKATSTAGSNVVPLAKAFQATLSSSLQTQMLKDYNLANAKLWSNFPQALLTNGMGGGPGGGGGARIGISLGDLDAAQLAAFNKLLSAVTGTAHGTGFAEIQQHLNADDYLGDNGGGDDYGRANFYIAYLGTPADTGTWQFQFGGHHLAVANTYVDGVLGGATPSFRGIEPNGSFKQNGVTNEPMAVKEAALAALLAGLSNDQLASALLDSVFSDLVLGPGQDWVFPTNREGVKGSTLSAAQKKLTLAAIAGYVNDIDDGDAAKILAHYENELDETYIAYSGTKALTELNDYIRIDGPSVWIELSMQHGIVLAGNHPHSVWRDRNTDYAGTKA